MGFTSVASYNSKEIREDIHIWCQEDDWFTFSCLKCGKKVNVQGGNYMLPKYGCQDNLSKRPL